MGDVEEGAMGEGAMVDAVGEVATVATAMVAMVATDVVVDTGTAMVATAVGGASLGVLPGLSVQPLVAAAAMAMEATEEAMEEATAGDQTFTPANNLYRGNFNLKKDI